MKKIIAILLVVALVFGLAACGGKKDPDPKNDPGKTTPAGIDDPGKNDDPGKEENPTKGVIPYKTEEEFRDFLSGMWVDDLEHPVFYMGLCSDNTLIIYNDTDMECFAYAGTWHLERLFAEDNEVPDLLMLPLTDFDDPCIEGLKSAGDYIFTEIDKDAVVPRMHLVQANNGDSIVSIYYDVMDFDMFKVSETVSFENPAESQFFEDGRYMDIAGHWTLVSGEVEGWEWSAKEEGVEGTLDLTESFDVDFVYTDKNYPANCEHYNGIQWWPVLGMTSFWYNKNEDGTHDIQQFTGAKTPDAYNDWSIFFRVGEEECFTCELTGENELRLVLYEFDGEIPVAAILNYVR